MHVLLVFECLLVEDFIVFLLSRETFGKAAVIRNLRHYVILGISCAHELVTHLNFIATTLVKQLKILSITNHALLTLLKAFPLLVLNHSCISIVVLTLEFNFLKLFCQACVFFRLDSFLGANIVVSLLETFLACCNSSIFSDLCVSRHLIAACISFLSSLDSCLFYLIWIFNQIGSFTFFLRKICVTFKLDFLNEFGLIQFNTLSQFSNWHLTHQAVITSFGGVETLVTLDRNLLKFAELTDKFFLLSLLGGLFISQALLTILHLLRNNISDLSVLILSSLDSLMSFLMLNMDLLDSFLVVVVILDVSLITFAKQYFNLLLNTNSKFMIFMDVLLLSKDGLISRQFHFDLHFLYAFYLLNIVFLFHFALPSVKLWTILETHLHLSQ